MKLNSCRKNISYKLLDFDDTQKLIIIKAKWGQITVNYLGQITTYRDVIIWNNGSRQWDWKISDTHHSPG